MAALFVISGNWKQTRCLQCSHMVAYYSAIKRDKILIPTIVCMDLQGILLRERKPTAKDTGHSVPFTQHPRDDKVVEVEIS